MRNTILNKIKKILKLLFVFIFKCKHPYDNIKIGKNTSILFSKIKSKRRYKNIITIGNNVVLKNCSFIFYGTRNIITIHDGAHLNNVTFWVEDSDNEIIIGEKSTFHGNCQLAACEGTSISIGSDCMFSHDIYVRTTDSHSIIKENKRINPAKNIKIGNHVWIGMQSLILKGTNIPDGCIIGARSTVSASDMENNSIYVGQPVKLVNKGIDWNRERF